MPTVPNYVRVGDRIVSCPPGSEWHPDNRSGPGSSNGPGSREVPIPRARRVQNWEPNPRLRSSSGQAQGHDSPSKEPSQEQTDNLTRRQIGRERAEVNLHKLAALTHRHHSFQSLSALGFFFIGEVVIICSFIVAYCVELSSPAVLLNAC